MYDGKTVDVSQESVTVEITGSEQKIDAAVETFGRFGIHEIVRTGTAALERGTRKTT
jgi:acetolactate synthase-1/3 small subunit